MLSALVCTALAPLIARAQRGRVAKIGYLTYGALGSDAPWIAAFERGLRDIGYTEGRNVHLERREAGARSDRLAALVAELLGLKIDVLVVTGDPATHAAKKATNTLPIIMVASPDPVGTGLIASLARPGGNITGLSDFHAGVAAKRFELLKEVAPSVARVAVLLNPAAPSHPAQLRDTQAAAANHRVLLLPLPVDGRAAIAPAFSEMRKARADALIVLGDRLFATYRNDIAELALRNQLPAIYSLRSYVEAGGLMSYGANFEDLFHRAATYVHRILEGARPADLPVEQPTKFELVINRKTALATGLAIPESLALRAETII